MTPSLKLFRRHESTCVQNYAKDNRIYEGDVQKRKGKTAKHDCDCTIYAEGTLLKHDQKNYLRPKSTGQHHWVEARKTADDWIKWGDTKPSAEPIDPKYKLVTVAQAVDHFITVKRNQNIQERTVKANRAFLESRLIPFASARHITHIQQMNNATIWGEFRASWKNLNPLRNKKPKPGQIVPDQLLAPGMAAKLISMLRDFMRICISNEWLSDNWASKEHGMKSTNVVQPKEPFSDEELEYIYRATELKTDGRGFKVKRTGQENARELLILVWVLRYTGLRISDVVQLETHQLAPFQGYGYTHALWCHPIKTKNRRQVNFVHIPIPSDNLPGHPNVAAALKSLQVKKGKYFFLAGEGTVETNIKSWRRRVNGLFALAEQLMSKDGRKFTEHPHPHKFRHTFAATLLQNGAPLRMVAQYMGDTEITVRKHYAKFCAAEQHEAAGVMAEAMRKMVQRQSDQKKGQLQVVK